MNHPFDEFSKSLSEPVPRRMVLRRLGAVFTGALLGPLALGLEVASANPDDRLRRRRRLGLRRLAPKSNPKRDPCQDFCRCNTAKKQSQCLAACRACSNNPSRLCGTCGSYTCSNLSSDPNCGACGNNCGANGQKCCGGRCADLKNDNANCGACGNASDAETTCVNGTCSSDTSDCPGGGTNCNGVCTNLAFDPQNCGACGNVCEVTCSGVVCQDGF